MRLLQGLLRDQDGTAAVQHALVIGVMALAVLAGSLALRGPLTGLYESMTHQANGALVDQSADGDQRRNGG